MATIGDLSGDEREQRAAELKRKMQEAAQRAKAARGEGTPPPAVVESTPPAATAPAVEATPVVTAVADGDAETATLETVAVAEQPVAESEVLAGPAEAPPGTNGQAATAAVSAPALAAAPIAAVVEEEDPEAAARRELNRREFLMYSWGAALGLLTLQAGVASFLFMYPRFREGEFGGNFIKPLADFADPAAAPNGEPTGKFWMVTTQEGEPRAIYMVCTHLGCLYKWVGANNRFECPCHGSKFSHDGYFIEGPAPRSLDLFEVTVQGDQVVVNTGRRIVGGPAAESPARAVAV